MPPAPLGEQGRIPYQTKEYLKSNVRNLTDTTARVVVPGLPHHITQRGNRRQTTFFGEEDYVAYLELMTQWCRDLGVEIWAYCLMPNHVHLIAVPRTEQSLRRAVGEAHRRYTRRINFREKWRGYLW